MMIAHKAGTLPSHIQLAAAALPITGIWSAPKKFTKDESGKVAILVPTTTASGVKVYNKYYLLKSFKNRGKRRKFLPVAEGSGMGRLEKDQIDKILSKILSQNSHEILNVDKAVSKCNVKKAQSGKNGHDKSSSKLKAKSKPLKAKGKVNKRPGSSKKGKAK